MEAGAMSICGKEDLHRPYTLLGKKMGSLPIHPILFGISVFAFS